MKKIRFSAVPYTISRLAFVLIIAIHLCNLTTSERNSSGLQSSLLLKTEPIPTRHNWWIDSTNEPKVFPKLNDCCKKGISWKITSLCSKNESVKYMRFMGPKNTAHVTPTVIRNLIDKNGYNIVIAGDSTSRQWYEALMCYLNIEWKGWASRYSSRAEVLRKDIRKVTDKIPMLVNHCIGYDRQKMGQGSITFYSINLFNVTNVLDVITYHSSRGAAPAYRIVIDYKSAHVSEKRSSEINDFQANLQKVVSWCIQLNAKCILREAFPQHFLSKVFSTLSNFTGLFDVEGGNLGCAAQPIYNYLPLARFRNEIIWSNRGNLSVLPIFDVLMPGGYMHFNLWDCTHYVFDSNIWEPLHLSLYYNLINDVLYQSSFYK